MAPQRKTVVQALVHAVTSLPGKGGRRRKRPAPRRDTCRKVLATENLERRELMAGDLNITRVDGLLRVEGTPEADTIVVRQNQDGTTTYVDHFAPGEGFRRTEWENVTGVEVLGHGGNDYLQVSAAKADTPVEVRGGAGADVVIAARDTFFADSDAAAGDQFIGLSEYAERVRGDLTRIFRDEYGFVVNWNGLDADVIGEATYFTAVAATAIALETFQLEEGPELDRANRELQELFHTLLTHGWSKPNGLGVSYPIRHPDNLDYVQRDVRNPSNGESSSSQATFSTELVPLRQSPLARDGFGQILTAALYSYRSPNTSDEVRGLARELIQKYSEFLVQNQWRLHVTAETRTIYDASGKPRNPQPEAYVLFPHERYALQNVAAQVGIASSHWNIWQGMSTALLQELGDTVASLAGRALDGILKAANLSLPYDVQFGPDRWDFHLKGSLDISISDNARNNAVQVFEDAIREVVRAYNLTTQQPIELVGVAINRILDLLPDEIGRDSWRSVLTTAVQQVLPWISGQGWLEAATFVVSLQGMKDPSDQALPIVGYTVWSFAAEMETRPEMADLLRPFVKEFYYNFLRPSANNDNALWAWLAGDRGRVSEHLRRFEARDPRIRDDYAWHRKADDFFSRRDDTFSNNQAPRLDYVVLNALHAKGAPRGLTGVVLSWRERLTEAAREAIQRLRAEAERSLRDAGEYVVQRWNAAGDYITERWTAAGDYITERLDAAGTKLRTTLKNTGERIEETLTKGVLTAKKTWNAAGQKASEYWRNGDREFRNLYTHGVRTAYTVWEDGANTLHYVYDTSGRYVSKYWRDGAKEISQWFTDGRVSAETIVQDGVKIAEKTWKDGVNTLNRVRDTAGRLVSEYWRDGSKEFRNLYTRGIRTSYTVWENSVNTVHYVWNTSNQYVTRYWRDGAKEISQWFTDGRVSAETIVQDGVKIAEKTWKDGVNTLNRVRDTAGRLVSEYWRDGNKEFRNLYTRGIRTSYTVWEGSVNTVHYVWNTSGDKVSEYWRQGAREFSNVYRDGRRIAQNVWENGRHVAQHVWNEAGSYVGDALSRTGSAAKNLLSRLGVRL